MFEQNFYPQTLWKCMATQEMQLARTRSFGHGRILMVAVCSLGVAVFFATYRAESDDTSLAQSGLLATPPAEGRFVQTDLGAMVVYDRTIPGTKVAISLSPIAGGTAKIGSPENEAGRNDDEGPVCQIEVDPFWMGTYEITWAQYKEFMKLCNIFDKFNDLGLRQITEEKNAVDAITAPSNLYDPSFTFQSGEDPQLPAVSMSQYAAKQFTKWLSKVTGEFYRLPTEAEWEYACRAGTTTAYSFGDDPAKIDDYAWHTDNSDWEAQLVGQKLPNPWGLYDMHGNAAEWVLDQYDAEHYGTLQEHGVSAAQAILWPTKLFPRVLRGGSWDHEIQDCRSASRGQSDDDEWRSYDPNSPQSPWWFASDESQGVGFRIVRPLQPPPKQEWAKYWDANLEVIERVVNRRIDEEGRGERGIVDPSLPAAIKKLAQ